jgi:murein DD-endopeptidase MepM/ murein hydrolase activator NlpD
METVISLRQPVDNGPITQGFGEHPEIYARFGLAGHNGIDYGVPIETPVKAAMAGQVVKVGYEENGYGNYLKINHGGYFTLYAHLTQVKVRTGQEVQKGEVIASSGNTGFSTGPHLHFELRITVMKSKEYPAGEVDPLPYMEAYPARRLSLADTRGGHTAGAQYRGPDARGADNGNSSVSDQLTFGMAPKETGPSTADFAGAQPPLREAGKIESKYDHCRITATAGLNLRLRPEITSQILGIVPYGVALPLVEQEGEWVGVLVWVNRNYVKIHEPE